MPTYHTPAAAAAIVGVSVSSMRNWCATFADYLSEGARPPAGTERKLIAQDIAILQRVKELRAQGMTTDEIKATLSTEDTSALQPYVDVVPVSPALRTVDPTESPQQGPQSIELYATVLQSVGALQARMDALQAQQDSQAQAATGRVTLFAVGVLVGLAVALIVVGVLWLAP